MKAAADLTTQVSAPTADNLVHLLVRNSGSSDAMGVRVRFGASLDARPPSVHCRFIADQEPPDPGRRVRDPAGDAPPGLEPAFQVVLFWVDKSGSHEVTEVVDAWPGSAAARP